MQVFWLDVSYLEVAAATLRCGAPFTALLYVEQWCEERQGSCTMDGIDASVQVCHINASMKTVHLNAAACPGV